jgi:hypothetical protein
MIETTVLSPIDCFEERTHVVRFMLYFATPHEVNIETVFHQLNSGLVRTASAIPFRQGKVILCGNSANLVQIDVDETDSIEFTYQDLRVPCEKFPTLKSFCERKAENFALSSHDIAQFTPEALLPGSLPRPVMIAQANFIPGGLLLVVGIHHSAVDGSGIANVIKIWAANSRNGAHHITLDSLKEMLDRTPMMNGSTNATIDDYPGLCFTNPSSFTPLQASKPDISIFKFSSADLLALKDDASPPSAELPWISTHDALAALLWRSTTAARSIAAYNSSGEEIESLLSIAVDGRHRLSPKISQNYLGNASLNCAVVSKVSDLTTPSRFSLYDIASMVRSAINDFGEQAFWDTIGLIESVPIGQLKRSFDSIQGPDFVITSWASMGLLEMDWGQSLGKPDNVRAIVGGQVGWTAILPKHLDNSIEVMVLLDTDAMNKLRSDPLFCQYAHWQCSYS